MYKILTASLLIVFIGMTFLATRPEDNETIQRADEAQIVEDVLLEGLDPISSVEQREEVAVVTSDDKYEPVASPEHIRMLRKDFEYDLLEVQAGQVAGMTVDDVWDYFQKDLEKLPYVLQGCDIHPDTPLSEAISFPTLWDVDRLWQNESMVDSIVLLTDIWHKLDDMVLDGQEEMTATRESIGYNLDEAWENLYAADTVYPHWSFLHELFRRYAE